MICFDTKIFIHNNIFNLSVSHHYHHYQCTSSTKTIIYHLFILLFYILFYISYMIFCSSIQSTCFQEIIVQRKAAIHNQTALNKQIKHNYSVIYHFHQHSLEETSQMRISVKVIQLYFREFCKIRFKRLSIILQQ